MTITCRAPLNGPSFNPSGIVIAIRSEYLIGIVGIRKRINNFKPPSTCYSLSVSLRLTKQSLLEIAFALPSIQLVKRILEQMSISSMRIPSDADQRSDLMAIAVPNSCRSPFQSDGDHRSKPMPITRPLG